MNRLQPFRNRIGTVAIVLSYLIAALLPTHAIAAADQEVVIPKEQVDSMIYFALWQQAYPGNEAVEALVYDLFILEAGKAGMNETDLTRVIGEFNDKVDVELHGSFVQGAQQQAPHKDTKLSDKEIVQKMIDISMTMPDLLPLVGKIWKTFTTPLRFVPGLDQATRIGSSFGGWMMDPQMLELMKQSIDLMTKMSQMNQAIAGGCDKVHKKKVKVSVKNFDGGKTAKETPSLNLPPEIIQSIQLNGSINITLNQLKDLSQIEFNKIHLSLDDMQQTLVEIDSKQDVLIDYMNNQLEREAMQALAEAKAAEHQLKLDAIESSISVISTLAGLIDPRFGKHLQMVGTTALQIGKSLDGWLSAVAGLNGLEKLTSLSTVVMTGNVLGAVMNVMSIFSDSGPSPDQLILEEIGKLRQEVNQLRTEMHERFDRIDEELNTIYTTMQDRFDKIDIQLGKINANILEVQRSLLELDLKLSRIERNNFELMDAAGRRPLLEALNGGLGYQERTGAAMPYLPDFVNYENIFQSWGAIHAFDALATGPSQRDFSDGALLTELNALPLDANLNYLNSWLKLHGLPGIANNRLASPRDWLFASRAYSQLGVEWPQHMQAIDPKRQSALDAVGADLESAMRSLSTIVTNTVPVGNSLLFSNVITYYQSKLDQVDGKLQLEESAFVKNVQNALQRNEPFDLYGGIDQPLTYQPPEVTSMTCNNTHEALPATNNLISLIPNFARYNLADYLRLGTVTACVTDDWVGQIERCYIEPEPPYSEVCTTYAQFRAVLTVYFNNVPLLSQSITDPEYRIMGNGGGDARWYWTMGRNYKAQFEALSAVDQPTPQEAAQQAELLNTTTAQIETRLAEYQQSLYGNMVNQLNSGTLHPAAVEAAGAKTLLEDITLLGLNKAIGNDDFLHAMLYGNQPLVDNSQILESYALSATQPITGAGLTVNPRLNVKETATQRTAAFTGMVSRYLNAISDQAHVESIDYIANTRRDLDLAMRIARIETAPAAEFERVYLPLVSR